MIYHNAGWRAAHLGPLVLAVLVLVLWAAGCSQSAPAPSEAPPGSDDAQPAQDDGLFTAGAWRNEANQSSPDCRFPQKLSAGVEVYAVLGICPVPAAKSKTKRSAPSPAPGTRTGALEVLINRPEGPTALILAAEGSCGWGVSWTEGSKIEAVVLVGDSPQFLSGLLTDTPLLASLDKRPCGVPPGPAEPQQGPDSVERCDEHECPSWNRPQSLPASGRPADDGLTRSGSDFLTDSLANWSDELDLLSRKLFDRPLAEAVVGVKALGGQVAGGRGGRPTEIHPVVIGRSLTEGDRYFSLNDYLYQPTWQQLLDLAERQGWIRPAISEDFTLWRQAVYEAEKRAALAEGLPAHLIPEFDEAKLWGGGRPGGVNYLVLDSRFEIPAGTQGYHFYIPAELPWPHGRDDRNKIYMIKDGSECPGSRCRLERR